MTSRDSQKKVFETYRFIKREKAKTNNLENEFICHFECTTEFPRKLIDIFLNATGVDQNLKAHKYMWVLAIKSWMDLHKSSALMLYLMQNIFKYKIFTKCKPTLLIYSYMHIIPYQCHSSVSWYLQQFPGSSLCKQICLHLWPYFGTLLPVQTIKRILLDESHITSL